jgi:hypothetical protein
MNENLNFWRIWDKKDIFPLFFAFLLVLIGILLGVYGWNQNLDAIMSWDVYSELNQKTLDNPPFFFQNLQFSSSSNLLYITERYLPSLVHVPIWAFYFLLACGLMGMSYILIGFSRLQGLKFFLGLLFLAVMLISMRFENLFLSVRNWPFLGVFVLIGGLQYILNSFVKNKSSAFLLGFWLLIWSLVLVVVSKFSVINQPLISLAAYGIGGMFILSIIFICFTAHEAFNGMIWLISQNSTKGKSNLVPYFLVSFIFVLNLLLIYFENSKTLDASAFIIAPVFLFFINTVLGLWGIKKYLDQTESFSFNQIGVWIYLGAAIIASGTVAFIYITGNDPFQELFEDSVAIASLVMSTCFFIHVLANYFQLFKQGLPVHKVIYKSPFSKLFLARTAGVFGILFFFTFKGYYSYFQFQAGQNNAIADFHVIEGDTKMAETFYKSSATFDLFNHKANLSLASMANNVGDKVNSGFFYNQSLQKVPNEIAYAGLSNCLENENLFFESIFEIEKGIKLFPKSNRLLTNLAYLQAKAKQTDSVFINLGKAAKLCPTCGTEQTNMLAFWIENGKKDMILEKSESIKEVDYLSYLANKQAIALMTNTKTEAKMPTLSKDSALNVSQLAYIVNSAANKNIIKGFDLKSLKSLSTNPSNEPFSEGLNYALASEMYLRKNKVEGLKKWYGLTNSSSKSVRMYQQNLGLMLIKEGLLDKGFIELEKAGDGASVALIKAQNLGETIETSLKKQSIDLSQGLTLTNYKEQLNKAPFNPYLLNKVADILIKNKKANEAYDLVFYSTDFMGDHPEILRANFKAALELSQYEYAGDALGKLKGKISAIEYIELSKKLAGAQVKGVFE